MLPRAEARRVKSLPSVLGARRSLSSLSHPLPETRISRSLSLSLSFSPARSLSLFLPTYLSLCRSFVPTVCPSPSLFLVISPAPASGRKVERDQQRFVHSRGQLHAPRSRDSVSRGPGERRRHTRTLQYGGRVDTSVNTRRRSALTHSQIRTRNRPGRDALQIAGDSLTAAPRVQHVPPR